VDHSPIEVYVIPRELAELAGAQARVIEMTNSASSLRLASSASSRPSCERHVVSSSLADTNKQVAAAGSGRTEIRHRTVLQLLGFSPDPLRGLLPRTMGGRRFF
jgi:hypothetical protein